MIVCAGYTLPRELILSITPPLPRSVWRAITVLGVTQIIGWGSTYYLLTILAGPIGRDLSMSPALVATGMSVLMVVSAGLGPYAGRLMDVHGAGPVMAAGSALAAAGLITLSFVQGPVSYFIAWAVTGASTAMILYPAAFTALTQIAPDRARRAITLLTLPGGLASTVFWPLTTWLLSDHDWRSICLLYAGLHLVICLPLHLLAIPPGGTRNALPEQHRTIVPGLPPALRRRAFYLFAALLALNSMLTVATLNQFTIFMAALQHPAHVVLAASMLFGISQLSARIIELLMGGSYDALKGTVFITLAYVVAVAILGILSPLPAAAILFSMIFGAANGLFTINRGALVLSLFGSEGYGHMSGKVAVAQGLAGASAPIIFAGIIGTGGGHAGVIFAFVLALAGAVAMAALFRHATAKDASGIS